MLTARVPRTATVRLGPPDGPQNQRTLPGVRRSQHVNEEAAENAIPAGTASASGCSFSQLIHH